MRSDLLNYYERELSYLRQLGAQFAQAYPKVAGRLQLDPTRCDDPHVERLLESFALIGARIHMRLDDDFPEITQALLNIVFPHYIRPLPSMSVVEMAADPKTSRLTTAVHVPKGTMLYSKPVAGVPCRFTTGYDTEVLPLRVTAAQWTTPDRLDPVVKSPGSVAALRIEIEAFPGASVNALKLKNLRFYLNAEGNVAHPLYELLCNNTMEILLRDPRPKFRQKAIPLSADRLRPVGLAPDEGLLPYPRRSFLGYRLLQEYFAFPEKFFFLELGGLEALEWSGFKEAVEIVFLVGEFERAERHDLLESAVSQHVVRLGCTPVINVYRHVAEPILLDQARHEYPLVADSRRAHTMEIFSIDEVTRIDHRNQQTQTFQPFFSFRHSAGERVDPNAKPAFWHAVRREPTIAARNNVSEITMMVVDLSGRPLLFPLDTLSVACMVTNADLPSRLVFGDPQGDFTLPDAPAVSRVVALRKPTPTYRPAVGEAALWRLISHLSLNYLSLVEEGRDAFQEILRLYTPLAQPFLEQQIDGILGLSSSRRFARVVSEYGISYVRGVRVELELDEDKFVGGGVYLFSSVMEQFLAQYVSMNSFSQLAVKTRQRKEVMREWMPRAGNRVLL